MRVRNILLAVLVALAAAGAGWYVHDQQSAARLERDLEHRYGVLVSTGTLELPGRRSNASYRKVPWFNRLAALRALERDLDRYRPAFLKQHLRRIYVFRTLTIKGESYGGTYDTERQAVYIAASWLGDNGRDPEAMGFHHELSSLLIHGYPEAFPVSDWRALNPAGFRYRFQRSTARNLSSGRLDLAGNEQTYERGFLSDYGTLSVEDDMNTFAQYVIGKLVRLRELESRYPRIAAKAAFIRRGLDEIGPWRAAAPGSAR
ncbi:MAG: hypothetical protein U5R46_14040 [Gammaproteobacteria bacterium]|nr:hypothetical protein [Gammaproteobacteria bacterium]